MQLVKKNKIGNLNYPILRLDYKVINKIMRAYYKEVKA